MTKPKPTKTTADFVCRVRRLIADRTKKVVSSSGVERDMAGLLPGKMLRTRLAARLADSGSLPANRLTLERACAATEMVHTASLCHDDVIDSSLIRRGRPALWRAIGASGAVLFGDLLLCEAMGLLLETEGGRYAKAFVAKIGEVCAAEAEQELNLRGKQLDERTCMRLARSKTGPLFAFIGQVCAGDDGALCSALGEAGYRIGTAYQLADDLLDVLGNEDAAGKTLGTDLSRRKFTLPQLSDQGQHIVRELICELCGSAIDCLDRWPAVRDGLVEFFACDLQCVFDRHGISLNVSVRLAT